MLCPTLQIETYLDEQGTKLAKSARVYTVYNDNILKLYTLFRVPALNLGKLLAGGPDDKVTEIKLDPYEYKLDTPNTASTVRSVLVVLMNMLLLV